MSLTPSQAFAEKNALDYKTPIYVAHFPELDPPANETYFSTSPLSFVADCHPILRAPSGISQQIIPEEGKASISALSIPFVDLDGFFTGFIAADTKANLQNRKLVILAGYYGMTSLNDFLNIYTGRVQDYNESRPGTYNVKITDAQRALQRKLFRDAAKETVLFESENTDILADVNIDAMNTWQIRIVKPDATSVMADDQYNNQLFIAQEGDSKGNVYYIGYTDTHHVAVSITPGGPIINPSITFSIDARCFIQPAYTKISMAERKLLPLDGYAGRFLIPTTGDAKGKIFQIISNDYYTFTVGLYSFGSTPSVVDPFQMGIAYGNKYKIIYHFQDDVPQPVTFNGNPISLLLMWLTSTGEHYSNGPYDVLSSVNGLGIPYEDVDAARFEGIRDTYFPGDSHNMDFTITKRETAKKFIESEIFKVLNMYPVLRGDGKISVAVLKPPLPSEDPPQQFTEKEIVGVPKWQGNLGSLINEIGFFTDYNGEDFLTSQFYINGDSYLDRGAGRKELTIQSRGLKDSVLGGSRFAQAIIPRRVNSVFGRFAVPPAKISVTTRFDRLLTESGDMVEFSHHLTPNVQNGVRGQEPVLVEVVQRTIDWKGGKVSMQLLDTGFQRPTYQVISPAMRITDVVSDTQFHVLIADGEKFKQFTSPVVQIITDLGLDKYNNITIVSIEPSIVQPALWSLVTISPAAPGLSAGWHVIFDDYDNVTDEQKIWGYIADSNDKLGTAQDPAHVIVP